MPQALEIVSGSYVQLVPTNVLMTVYYVDEEKRNGYNVQREG